MNREPLIEVLRLCVAVEADARDVYAALAGHGFEPALCEFWQEMSREESGHIQHWNELLKLAQQDVNERWRMYQQLASLDYSA